MLEMNVFRPHDCTGVFCCKLLEIRLDFFFLRAAPTLPGSKNSLGTKCVEYFCHSLYVLSLLQLFHPEPTTDQHLLLLLALKYATKPL